MTNGLPQRVFAWYGDDFSGSTDVLEALAKRRLSAVLFLEPPAAGRFARFENYRAFGLAGSSRSQRRPRDPERDGLEIVLKGGHVGPPDFFSTVLRCGA